MVDDVLWGNCPTLGTFGINLPAPCAPRIQYYKCASVMATERYALGANEENAFRAAERRFKGLKPDLSQRQVRPAPILSFLFCLPMSFLSNISAGGVAKPWLRWSFRQT